MEIIGAQKPEYKAIPNTGGEKFILTAPWTVVIVWEFGYTRLTIKNAKGETREKLKSERADLRSSLEALETEMDEYGYAVSPDVAKIIAGKKTLDEVFLKGEGDFAW